jgi:hypothetical protein
MKTIRNRFTRQSVARASWFNVKKRFTLPVLLLIIAVISMSYLDRTETKKGTSEFYPKVITLKELENSNFKELVDDRLLFIDSTGQEWLAPKGTITDGASVPRLALWVTDGRYDKNFLKAAVIHDAYCQIENKERCPEQFQKRPWRMVHRMFYEACLAGGTSANMAGIMFAAVWLGGPRWNDPVHNLDQVDQETMLAEFKACKTWIEKENPSIAQIEAWMDKREPALLAGK